MYWDAWEMPLERFTQQFATVLFGVVTNEHNEMLMSELLSEFLNG